MSTAAARSFRPADSRSRSTPGPGVWLAALVVLALLAFVVAWLTGWIRFTTDPRVLEIRELRAKARTEFGPTGPATPAEARAAQEAMSLIREKTAALPATLRQQAEREAGRERSVFQRRIDAYFAVPPAQRVAELDRQIDQDEMMRQVAESRPAAGGPDSRPGGAAGAGGSPAPGSGGSTPSGGGSPASSGGGSGRSSDEGRNKFLKSIIDRTRPEERARYVEYRRAVEERRQQRGLPSSGWGR